MRMTHPLEAFVDDYDILNVYMKRTLFNGESSKFYLKDSKGTISPLTLLEKSFSATDDYTKYRLKLKEEFRVGEEYTLFEEHCRTVPVRYGHIVKTDRFNETYTDTISDLGCYYLPEKTRFRIWSPVASGVLVVLYEEDGSRCFVDMTRKKQGVFETVIEEDLLGTKYHYLIKRNGEIKKINDPFSPFSGPNGKYSVVDNMALLPKPKKYDLPKMKSNCDAIIYETSIRDMTSMPNIGIKHPKTFKGFVEENEVTKEKMTGFSYLKSLGVTHVQLMPVFDFGSVDEENPEIYYNWGYDPVQYRVLEGSYCTNVQDHRCRIEEFVEMVEKLHEAGIRVNLDLVFNHVYDKETNDLDQMVPNYFFLINENGGLSNGSWCGNDIDTRAPVCREYFVRTCKKIIEWFDIDGFRFDLMGILDIETINKIRKMAQEIKPDFMIYGEGWNMPSFVPEHLRASQNNQALMDKVGHFSDSFREAVRGSNGELPNKGYAAGNYEKLGEMSKVLSGELNRYSSPEKVINYVECHDNHTLWDKNHHACLGEDHQTRMKRQALANAITVLAQGVPFIHCGQEFGRSKQNLGNTYNMSDMYNSVNYNRRNDMIYLVEEMRKLIQIRKSRSCFRLSTLEEITAQVKVSNMDNKVCVYSCEDSVSKCVSFFNPSPFEYTYHFEQAHDVLFDNGNKNHGSLNTIKIAPYSAVIVEKKK
ncbi:MAG: type I pullulanase [Bacillota bacterium]|nr:type I pullulanase [Bacillota bacterium]